MARKKALLKSRGVHRRYTDEFKAEAVQMLLDGHTGPSVMTRPGLSNMNLLDRWKQEKLPQSGPVASSLDARVRELQNELRRVERERDILKKALDIFGRSE
jgi:transposase